jgi:phage portal protein BeeE
MEQGREHSRFYEGGGQRQKVDKNEWTIVYNTHEAIISQDLFDRANAVINERTAVYKKNQNGGFLNDEVHDNEISPHIVRGY